MAAPRGHKKIELAGSMARPAGIGRERWVTRSSRCRAGGQLLVAQRSSPWLPRGMEPGVAAVVADRGRLRGPGDERLSTTENRALYAAGGPRAARLIDRLRARRGERLVFATLSSHKERRQPKKQSSPHSRSFCCSLSLSPRRPHRSPAPPVRVLLVLPPGAATRRSRRKSSVLRFRRGDADQQRPRKIAHVQAAARSRAASSLRSERRLRAVSSAP